ncbi:MAG: hypothetical protein JXA49_02595 [Actinobacteria bacterium]|nr:hypothetical protein [Actinomycetota bacterium]
MDTPETPDEVRNSGEEAMPNGSSRLRPALKRNIPEMIIFLFYFLMTGFLTWPVISNFSSALYGIPSDNMGTTWLLWWYRNAGSFGSNATFCPLIGAPFGQGINAMYAEFIYQFGAKFLLFFVNEVLLCNLIVFTSFFLSGITMYYLVRHVTRSKPAAFVGGFAYMICTYHAVNSMLFPNLSIIQWMPLAMLLLIRLIEKPGWKNCILFCSSLILTAGTCLHYGLFTIIFTITFSSVCLTCFALQNRKADKEKKDVEVNTAVTAAYPYRQTIILIIISIFITVAVIVPFFTLQIITETTTGELAGIPTQGSSRTLEATISGSAKLKDYVIPNAENFTVGRIVRKLNKNDLKMFNNSLYIGWTILVLAIASMVIFTRKRSAEKQPDGAEKENSVLVDGTEVSIFESAHKRIILWGFFAGGVSALVFSLPPNVYIGDFAVPMPSLVFRFIAPWFRWYLRFGVMVAACVIVIACFAVQHIIRNMNTRWRYAIIIILTVVIFCETAVVPPFKYFKVDKTPEIFRLAGKLPEDSSLVIYPAFEASFFHSQRYLLYQRYFQRPMLNGGYDYSDGEALRRTVYNPFNPMVPSILSSFGITHVIYLRKMFELYEGTENKEEEMSHLPQGLELINRIESDDIFSDGYLFKVADRPSSLVPFYAGRISTPFIDQGKITVRLLAGTGEIHIVNFAEEQLEADIEVPINNIASPHHLNISIDGDTVWEGDLTGDQQESVRLSNVKIPAGGLIIVLTPSGPAVKIDEVEVNFFGTPTAFLKLGDVSVKPRIIQ